MRLIPFHESAQSYEKFRLGLLCATIFAFIQGAKQNNRTISSQFCENPCFKRILKRYFILFFNGFYLYRTSFNGVQESDFN